MPVQSGREGVIGRCETLAPLFIKINLGFLEGQVIPRGTADDRHVVPCLIKGLCKPFFHHGQSINDQKPEGVPAARVRNGLSEGRGDPKGLILIVGQGLN